MSSVLQLIGILLSLFRLWFRLKIQRLWWEDAWSLVACVSAIAVLTAEWMYLEGGTYQILFLPGHRAFNLRMSDWQVSVVGFWIYSVVFTCVIWYATHHSAYGSLKPSASRAVRMSILYSVARIAHSTKRMRRMVTALAALFSVFFLSFTAMKVWWFSHDLSWLEQPSFYTKPASWMPYSLCVYELCSKYAHCSLGVKLRMFSADCISDTILIFLPVRLLWKMDLPPKHRRMIIAIFSSSVIVTAISILRGVSEIQNQLSLVGVATDFQVWLFRGAYRVPDSRNILRQRVPPSTVICSWLRLSSTASRGTYRLQRLLNLTPRTAT